MADKYIRLDFYLEVLATVTLPNGSLCNQTYVPTNDTLVPVTQPSETSGDPAVVMLSGFTYWAFLILFENSGCLSLIFLLV